MADPVYGFNGRDADALIRVITNIPTIAESSSRPRPFGMLRAEAKTGGIAAFSTGDVYIREWDETEFVTTTDEVEVYNDSGSAILAGDKLILFPIEGIWLAVVTCE